jgi:arylsulfatase A-like enzyme
MKILVLAPMSLHLGYLGCYGNTWVETPTLDALAAEGVVFDNHYSDCPDVDGAWRAWRTGLYDFPRPGVQRAFLPSGSADILSLIRARGNPTWLVSAPGGDSGADPDGAIRWEEFTLILGEDRDTAGMLSRKVMRFVRQLEHFDDGLIWVQPSHLLPAWTVDEFTPDDFSGDSDEESPETPIDPLLNPKLSFLDPSDELTFLRLQRTYAGAVNRLDRELGELLDQLRQQKVYDQMVIILTTDRGFPLGEHGLVGDSLPWLHEELVHLPLIIRLPNQASAGERIGALTQPVDLMPTLLEAFGLPSVETHGSSVLPLIKGERDRIRDYACSGMEKAGAIEYALRTPDWAFILPEPAGETKPRAPQLYVKPDDRWEMNNVLQHHTEMTEQLEQALRSFIKAPFQAQGLQPLGLESVNPHG